MVGADIVGNVQGMLSQPAGGRAWSRGAGLRRVGGTDGGNEATSCPVSSTSDSSWAESVRCFLRESIREDPMAAEAAGLAIVSALAPRGGAMAGRDKPLLTTCMPCVGGTTGRDDTGCASGSSAVGDDNKVERKQH